MKKIFIELTGTHCSKLIMELNQLKNWIEKNEHLIVDNKESSDIIVLGTCGFDQFQEDSALKEIKELSRSDKEIIIYGCLVKINLDKVIKATKSMKKLHLVGPDMTKLMNVIDYTKPSSDLSSSLILEGSKKAFIDTGNGCTNNCSYCAVKFARPFKSRKLSIIKKEVKDFLAKGCEHIVLVSEDVGSYGIDHNKDLRDLINYLLFNPISHVSFSNIYPGKLITFKSDILRLIKADKLKSVHISLNSQNSRVLNLMNRKYDLNKVVSFIKKLRKESSEIRITTDIIIGFPTETDEEFLDSLKNLDLFDKVSFTLYSERPNTASGKIFPKVPKSKILQRLELVKKMAQKNKNFSLELIRIESNK